MNLLKRTPATEPQSVATIAETIDAGSLTRRLSDQRDTIRTLDQEAEALESRLSDLLATKAMGGAIDVDELARITERRIANREERDQAALLLAGMESNLARLQEQEGERARSVLLPEFERIDTEMRQLETEYAQALSALGETLEAMQSADRQRAELDFAWRRTAGGGDVGHGIAPIRQLLDIPANLLKAKRRSIDQPLTELVARWVEEPARHRERMATENARTAAAWAEIRKAEAEERRRFEKAVEIARRDGTDLFWNGVRVDLNAA